jgi:hypothetical protein
VQTEHAVARHRPKRSKVVSLASVNGQASERVKATERDSPEREGESSAEPDRPQSSPGNGSLRWTEEPGSEAKPGGADSARMSQGWHPDLRVPSDPHDAVNRKPSGWLPSEAKRLRRQTTEQ